MVLHSGSVRGSSLSYSFPCSTNHVKSGATARATTRAATTASASAASRAARSVTKILGLCVVNDEGPGFGGIAEPRRGGGDHLLMELGCA